MITQAINLNLIPGQVLPRVNVSQYDSGTRTLQLSVFNGTQAFNITSGINGFIQGTKPDRTGFQYSATVTEGSNVVTADITQQMTAVSGEVTCELVLTSGDDRIATVNFIIYVEPAALADDTVISETELPLIEEAAELAEQIGPIIDQIEADVENAEAWAAGTKSGTPVTSSDPQYHNNAKYWSDYTAAHSVTSFNGRTGAVTPQSGDYDAGDISYDNTTSGLTATDVKAAIDEIENGLGTAAAKDSTNAVTQDSTDLVESGAVYTGLDGKFDKTGGTISGNVAIEKTATGYTIAAISTKQINSVTGNNFAQMWADQEGGNIRLEKAGDTAHLDFDTYGMNGSSGYARLYLGKSGTENSKEFRFNEDGSFRDGNGINTALTMPFMPIFATTSGRGAITDVLNVNTASATADENKVGYCYSYGGYTSNIPSDFDTGIREVFYYNANLIMVKLHGVDKSSNYGEWAIWYNGSGWSGWGRLTISNDYVTTTAACNSSYFTNQVVGIQKMGNMVLVQFGAEVSADIPVGNIVLASSPYTCRSGVNFSAQSIFQTDVNASGYINTNSTDIYLQVTNNAVTNGGFIRGQFIYFTD